MPSGDWVHTLWEGNGVGARTGRAILMPFELVFGAIAEARGALYDAGVFATKPTAVPALGVGNLTVGGTGKTPVAAWFARRLREAGATPAIVLRGYADDEPRVHRTLNPDVEVVVSPDRVAASIEAKRRGCDTVVFDDAFQHRRANRISNIVIVSADAWRDGRRHLLPAGPWREPLAAVRRASLAIVTRKAASPEQAAIVSNAIGAAAAVPTAVVHIAADGLARVGGTERFALSALRGESVLAISGIGDPEAFHAQLIAAGARVTPAVFRDHHPFSPRDATVLVAMATACDRVVCTLKDAVKLGPLWPGSTPLWYLSQRLDVERGADLLNDVITQLLAARSASTPPGRPGLPGPPD